MPKVITSKRSETQILQENRLLRKENEILRGQIKILEENIKIDHLTGIGNRKAFSESIIREVSRLVRTPGSLILVFSDLDKFKMLNDTMGHQAGDEALEAVSRTLNSALKNFSEKLYRSLRATDYVFRLGGDEFAVLAPVFPTLGVPQTVALEGASQKIKNRIIEALEAENSKRRKAGKIPIEMSIGLGYLKGPLSRSTDINAVKAELIIQADRSMYKEKRRSNMLRRS